VTAPADHEPALDAPGRLVAGRYRLARVLATGGMGEVWCGYDERSEHPVAVKVLRPEFAADPAFVERFRAEARTSALLDHPNIATVVDYGEQTGPHGEPTGAYLVMELVDGEPLSAILRREAPLPAARVLRLLAQAGAGLQAAHDGGVVHRDIKPANLLVTADDTVKITDFGIARATGALPLTRTGTVLGTAHYLSPEQVQGRSASPASDLYALGVVAYECLAGHRPFDADSPLEVALAHQRDPVPPLPDSVHPAVVALVGRALAKDPTDRHRSAGAFGRTAAGIAATLYSGAATTSAGTARTARSTTPASTMPSTGAAGQPPAAAPQSAPAAPAAPPGTASTQPARRRPGTSAAQSGRHPDRKPRGGHQRVLRLPMLVLGGLLLAALVAAVVGGHGHTRHTAAPATTAAGPAAQASGVALDPRTYAGRPAASVLAELQAKGLTPSTQSVAVPGTPGTVVTIVTSGGAPLPASLPTGSAVVVQVVATP
jgi:hypothetical protein